MIARHIKIPLSALLTLSSLAGCATVAPPARLDSFNLGRNTAGEGCIAARNWNDPGAPDAFSRAYALTCSSAAANRPVGTLRAVARTPEALAAVDAQFDCAEPHSATVAGGPATVRRCLDRVTELETVRVDTDRGDTHYVAAGAPALVPQLEESIAIASGARAPSADVTRVPATGIDIANLPLRPGAAVATVSLDTVPLNISGALTRGIDLNHKGLNVEASRVLNDALSRLTADTPPATRAELQLEAGLADSNILFPEAAKAHFNAADQVFANAAPARTAFLLRKRDTYLALDAINRHAYSEALTLLDRVAPRDVPAGQPLQDPETLRQLNQPPSGDGAGATALAVPDAAQLSQLVLDAQAQYARSISYLSMGDRAHAETAITAAAALYRPLANGRIDQAQLLWLGARIERQRGRIEARGGDYRTALVSFNDSIDMLRRSSIANAGTGAEPAIAEAELERAALFARTGAPKADARSAFASAIDDLISSGATSMASAVGMEDYLDMLVAEASGKPQSDTYERFFRAMQASGEPAVARQLTQLRSVVTADPKLAAAMRQRTDLEREITRLRYAIADGTSTGKISTAELETARGAAERQLLAVDAQLSADPRYRQVDESPVTLAELRKALRPGEAFVKLTELDRRIYGIVVTADRTFIYHVATSAGSKQAVDTLGAQLRESIDGNLGNGKLVPFDEARAYTLYRLVTGPAADALASARAIVIDPAGPLERLPIGVLITHYDPKATRDDPFDFSQTAFLAKTASISTALSPRSFLIARALPPSRASRPFLGMGEHQQPDLAAGPDAARMVPVGFGCSTDFGKLTALSRTLKPINRRELEIGALTLRAGPGSIVTGAQFSDTGVEARNDLDQYQVVHFATHGLEEGVWGCPKSPPGLVTSFGGPDSDGLLSFSEIAALRLDANLVVLSACDTAAGVRDQALARASGQEESGNTLEGLVRAFLTANARAVLATYWQVSAEHESDEFIRTFYAQAGSGTIGDALQAAQRDLMTQPAYSHPFYWGPYFLVGDSSKTMLSPVAANRLAAR